MSIHIQEDPDKLILLERIAVAIEDLAAALGGTDSGDRAAAKSLGVDIDGRAAALKAAIPETGNPTP